MKLPAAFLADEAGAMDNYPIEAMRSGQISMLNKLGIIVSTQYPNDRNSMILEIDAAKKSLDGVIEDKRRFSLLYEPDDEFLQGEKWKTEDLVIYQSNPSAVQNSDLFQNILKKRAYAILYEDLRENYLCKHNNIMYKGLGTEGYVEITKVRECRIEENRSFWEGKRVYLGLDLSQTEDNTAVAMATLWKGKIYGKVWGFLPEERVEDKSVREKVNYRELIRDGCCYACGEQVIDYAFVERFILRLEAEYGVEVIQLGYDRYNAISSVQKLEAAENPIECVQVVQHSKILHRPTKLLKEYILRKEFCYEPNKLLEINFQNARCTEDTNLNKFVNKKRSAGKVDCIVALLNAIYLLDVNEILDDGSGWGAMAF